MVDVDESLEGDGHGAVSATELMGGLLGLSKVQHCLQIALNRKAPWHDMIG